MKFPLATTTTSCLLLTFLLSPSYLEGFTTTTNHHLSAPSSLQQQQQTTSSRSQRFASTLDEVDTTTATTADKKENNENGNTKYSFREQLTKSTMGSAALLATAAVNQAVSMKSLEAPDVTKTYISLNNNKTQTELDAEGLPLVYDKDLIQAYWSRQKGALNQRWSYFVGKAVPFFTKLVTLFIRDGEIKESEIPALSRQARMDLQDLGPTFIKAGQMMSVRPDVLPQATLDELQELQDSVIPFDTKIAVEQIERELGGPLGQFFTSISEEPVAGTLYNTTSCLFCFVHATFLEIMY